MTRKRIIALAVLILLVIFAGVISRAHGAPLQLQPAVTRQRTVGTPWLQPAGQVQYTPVGAKIQ